MRKNQHWKIVELIFHLAADRRGVGPLSEIDRYVAYRQVRQVFEERGAIGNDEATVAGIVVVNASHRNLAPFRSLKKLKHLLQDLSV